MSRVPRADDEPGSLHDEPLPMRMSILLACLLFALPVPHTAWGGEADTADDGVQFGEARKDVEYWTGLVLSADGPIGLRDVERVNHAVAEGSEMELANLVCDALGFPVDEQFERLRATEDGSKARREAEDRYWRLENACAESDKNQAGDNPPSYYYTWLRAKLPIA